MNLSNKEYLFLKLSRIDNIKKSKLFSIFLENDADCEKTLNFINEVYKKKYPNIIIPSDQEIESEIKEMMQIHQDAGFIFYGDKFYPSRLMNIESPPFALSYIGDKNILKKQNVTIIGTRNPTSRGMRITQKIVHQLRDQFVTVSGFAKGIDTIVHRESLKFGTIGIIGSGLKNLYPKENISLFHEIIKNGIILSEFHINEPPISSNFPKRNRIIAAVSNSTIVTQATIKSGTLITARLANEYNRNVYVVPGDVEDQSFNGNNYLISANLGQIIVDINKINYLIK